MFLYLHKKYKKYKKYKQTKAKTMESFIEFYKSLKTRKAQKIMRERVIEACEIENSTFYSWLQRGDVPVGKNRERICEVYGVPMEIFFPEKQKPVTDD